MTDSEKVLSGTGLDSLVKYSGAIGSVAILWNGIQALVWHYFQACSGLPENLAKAIFFTLKSDSAQRDVTLAVIKESLNGTDFLERLESAFTRMQTLSGERNALIHAMWALDPERQILTPNPAVNHHKRLESADPEKQLARLESDLLELLNEFVAIGEELIEHYPSPDKPD